MRLIFSLVLISTLLSGCKNEALHDGDEFKPRIIHEDQLLFDRIEVDGIEYLILEKDYNNPHEGFGFMAFRANQLMEKQDSLIAYMRTMLQLQSMIYSDLKNIPLDESLALTDSLYYKNLQLEEFELYQLERSRLLSKNRPGDTTLIKVDSIK